VTTGRTRLVVHADDFGLSPGVNRAVERGFASGAITSASILVAGAGARDALAWAAAHPAFDCGVHLDLTHGAPALPVDRVRSLVDERGRFLSLAALFSRLARGAIRLREIREEWSAQIAAAEAAGVSIGHLDSHHHVHLHPPIFRSVAEPLARERGIPLRTMDGPAGFVGGRLDAKGILLAAMSRVALRGASREAPRARGTGTALMGSPSLAVLAALLRRMEGSATYELVVHPGYCDDALRRSGDTYLEGRDRERSFLDSGETRRAIASAGVELVALRDAQLRQGGGSAQWT
jgi:predicted glycoside hydrolase/deacetylase ChbG (UPF0249 family)